MPLLNFIGFRVTALCDRGAEKSAERTCLIGEVFEMLVSLCF